MGELLKAALIPLVVLLFVAGCGSDPNTASRSKKSADASTPEAGATGNESYNLKALSDIRNAKNEGKSYPAAPPPERRSADFRRSLPGTPERACVGVTAGTKASPGARARSGEIVINAIYLYIEAGKRYAKIPWSRLHLKDEYFANGGGVSDLTIRAASLEKPKDVHTQKLSNDGAGYYYSGTALPGEGPWRLVATSGPDWGCFDLKAS